VNRAARAANIASAWRMSVMSMVRGQQLPLSKVIPPTVEGVLKDEVVDLTACLAPASVRPPCSIEGVF
jgi:hypothetical protein